jgi:hypothetical protein
MATKRSEAEWIALSAAHADAGWKCVLARHEVERFPTTQSVIDDYTTASEQWIDHVLKVSDFVRDCPAA